MSVEYLKVDVKVCKELGFGAAILLAYLCYVSKTLPKDSCGYFALDSSFSATVGIDRDKMRYYRDKLATKGIISYIPGRNHNAKPRYKLL